MSAFYGKLPFSVGKFYGSSTEMFYGKFYGSMSAFYGKVPLSVGKFYGNFTEVLRKSSTEKSTET